MKTRCEDAVWKTPTRGRGDGIVQQHRVRAREASTVNTAEYGGVRRSTAEYSGVRRSAGGVRVLLERRLDSSKTASSASRLGRCLASFGRLSERAPAAPAERVRIEEWGVSGSGAGQSEAGYSEAGYAAGRRRGTARGRGARKSSTAGAVASK